MSHECYMNVTFRFCFRSPLKSLKLPVFKGLSTDLGSHSFLHISFYPLYEDRAQIIASLKYVDEVVAQTSMDKLEFLKQRHFDVMFHGDEWKGTDLYNRYETEFKKYGAKIDYLVHTDGISSTLLRKKIQN